MFESPGGLASAVGSPGSLSSQSRLFRLSCTDVAANFPIKEPERMGHLMV